jgi:hypothetical protein
MNRRLNTSELFMMVSNIFLIVPAIVAGTYHQWLYCFFASGIFIFSPFFHWYRIKNSISTYFRTFKTIDWLFAVSAFLYMYYYTYRYTDNYRPALIILLTLVVVFFWYGWKHGSYEKFHPWFHILAPLVSTAILVAAK